LQRRIQDFKLGGGALKKIAPSGGRREHVWGYFVCNSTLYKNAGFSLDKSYAIFRKYYDFLQFFLHHGIFFPAILSAVVFFRNTTAGGKIKYHV
jgi:hypothetical protein